MQRSGAGEVHSDWDRYIDGQAVFTMDNYQDARTIRGQWRGIGILNHHRPMHAYMNAFLTNSLHLTFFDEPRPDGYPPEDAEKAGRYRRVPYFLVMKWQKPKEDANVQSPP
ncbi:MAG: hypothetical protein ACFB03_17465 [Paracoccaceae bacterium]